MGKGRPGHAHRRHRPVVAHLGEAFLGELMDQRDGRFFGCGLGDRQAPLLLGDAGAGLADLLLLELLVGTVAEREICRVLACTQVSSTGFFGGEGLGAEVCAGVGAVAERLAFASTAGAEVVLLALAKVDGGGFGVRDDR